MAVDAGSRHWPRSAGGTCGGLAPQRRRGRALRRWPAAPVRVPVGDTWCWDGQNWAQPRTAALRNGTGLCSRLRAAVNSFCSVAAWAPRSGRTPGSGTARTRPNSPTAGRRGPSRQWHMTRPGCHRARAPATQHLALGRIILDRGARQRPRPRRPVSGMGRSHEQDGHGRTPTRPTAATGHVRINQTMWVASSDIGPTGDVLAVLSSR